MRQSLSQRLAQTAQSRRPWPDRPVAVGIVITDLDIGGAEKVLTSLAVRLNQGVAAGGFLPGEARTARPGFAPGGRTLRMPGSRAPETDAGDRPANRGLRRFRPELVQSFLFHANLAARLSAPWAGCSWVLGGIRVAEHQKRWHLTLDRLTAAPTGSVCVSRGVMQFDRAVARLDLDRLTVIPNGIDPAPIDAAVPAPRATLGVPDNAHLAIYVGRLDPQKGLPGLLDAAERVIRERRLVPGLGRRRPKPRLAGRATFRAPLTTRERALAGSAR